MPDVQYRLYVGDKAATREQLDQVEEITVEQETDMAWEARLQVPICTDENGRWSDEDAAFLASFTRMRVEIKLGDGAWVALIDGPVVGSDRATSSEPGQSAITVIVQDDSVYLNRKDALRSFENLLDHEIATQLFGAVAQLASTDVETTPAGSTGLPPVEVQRGTEIELLRKLAKRQRMHAYVLPGSEPGASVGVFKKFPTKPDGLPPLVLLGPDRNVATFNVKNDAQQPSDVEAYSLAITDKVVTKATIRIRDLRLLGDDAGLTPAAAGATRVLPPGGDGSADVNQRVAAEADRAGYAFEASGTVLGDCYAGVLTPYRVVTVKGVNGRLSGDYVLGKVSHRLTRSTYAQSFTLLRNAVSAGAGGGLESLAEAIF